MVGIDLIAHVQFDLITDLDPGQSPKDSALNVTVPVHDDIAPLPGIGRWLVKTHNVSRRVPDGLCLASTLDRLVAHGLDRRIRLDFQDPVAKTWCLFISILLDVAMRIKGSDSTCSLVPWTLLVAPWKKFWQTDFFAKQSEGLTK